VTGRVALVGLGEVGRTLAEDLRARGVTDVAAWDVAFDDPTSRASRNAAELGVAASSSVAEAVGEAALVVCAVTAARSVDAARSAAPHLAPGAWFVDVNSSSPAHKAAAAAVVDGAGGRYVEAALMSPIGPRRIASPFLLGGPHAAAFAAEAPGWGFTGASVSSERVGRAAATKLCRSVLVKGLEALFTESLLAARQYGVEEDVLASLPNILPPGDWEQLAGYFVSRSVEHGVRRAEEMEEAAATVEDTGVTPWMSRAAVERQRWAAQFRDVLPADGGTTGLVDALLDAAGLGAPGSALPGADTTEGTGVRA